MVTVVARSYWIDQSGLDATPTRLLSVSSMIPSRLIAVTKGGDHVIPALDPPAALVQIDEVSDDDGGDDDVMADAPPPDTCGGGHGRRPRSSMHQLTDMFQQLHTRLDDIHGESVDSQWHEGMMRGLYQGLNFLVPKGYEYPYSYDPSPQFYQPPPTYQDFVGLSYPPPDFPDA
ncbi:hypothetical protein LXL04_026044 [Taraxacum kok-saghyz]